MKQRKSVGALNNTGLVSTKCRFADRAPAHKTHLSFEKCRLFVCLAHVMILLIAEIPGVQPYVDCSGSGKKVNSCGNGKGPGGNQVKISRYPLSRFAKIISSNPSSPM